MRIICSWLVGIILVAGPCVGDWPIIGSWPAPGPNPRGIDGGISPCWLVVDGSPPYVYQVNDNNGSIYTSFIAPGGSGAWGITRGSPSNNFYISNYSTSYIYRVTTAGSVVGSFHCAMPGPADMDSPYDALYIAFPNQNLIARVDTTTGSILASYPGPGSCVSACYSRYYFAADTVTHTVYQNGGAILTGIQTPVGLCGMMTTYRDSAVIWVVDDATDRIYISGMGLGVGPASLGRVKAVYR